LASVLAALITLLFISDPFYGLENMKIQKLPFGILEAYRHCRRPIAPTSRSKSIGTSSSCS
jgi:hypothetical protein